MAFAPGDIVTLKSGGHPMTVVSVDDEDVECVWLGDTGELFRQSIPAIALAKSGANVRGPLRSHRLGHPTSPKDLDTYEPQSLPPSGLVSFSVSV